MPPEVALAGLLAVLAIGATWSALAPAAFANLMNVLIVTGIMWPRLYEIALPPRYVLAVFLALGAVSCALCIQASVASRTFTSVMIICYTSFMLIAFLEFNLTTPEAGDSYFRYFAVAPLSAVYGYFLVRSGRTTHMGRAFLTVAVISAILAIVEVVSNRPLLSGNPFDVFIKDQYRAAVFSEHALVLASFLICAVAVALVATRGALRIVAIALLLAGVVATSSRGALTLAVIYLVAAMIWARIPSIRRYGPAFRAVLMVLFFALPVILLSNPSAFARVTSPEPTTASLQYRGALYSLTVSSLSDRPLGWGPPRPPMGEYTLRSPFGVLDVSTTVDSELVQMVLEFGYVGAILLVVITIVVISRVRAWRWWSHIAVLVTAAGFYLSIHSWLGLLSLWAVSIGATLANPPTPGDVTATEIGSEPVVNRLAPNRADVARW